MYERERFHIAQHSTMVPNGYNLTKGGEGCCGYKHTPEEMAKFLDKEYPTKEDSIKVVESPVLIPTFKKEDYWGVEGFGDVIESNLSWNKEVMRKKVGHLFCHMTGVWKYSDNGIDWTPIREEFAEEFKAVA